MGVSFSRLQIIFLLLLSLGISNHVLIIPHLLKSAGRDAWISILLAYLALIVWSVVLFWILKSMNTLSFQSWIEGRIGKIGFKLIGGGFALYLLVAGMMIVFDTTKNVSIYFLPRTASAIIILSFIFLTYCAARGGLKTIVYMSSLLLPIVWLLGIGVAIMTKSSKDYGMLYPILTEGIAPDLRGVVVVFGGSIDFMVLLLLQHKLKKPLNYSTIFVLLTLLVGLIMGPTIGSLASFGPVQAENFRFPAFEQWRLVMIGRHISHIDFLAAFQLMAGSIVRTALIIHLLSQLIGLGSEKYARTIMICITIVISIPSLLMISDISMQEFIHRYFYTYSLWFGVAITAILFVITHIPRRREEAQ